MTKEELQERYKTLSNSELMDIIDDKFSYTETAVLVAMEEISKRNLNEEDIKKYKTEKEDEMRDYVYKNIADDLSFFQKTFFFFVWIPILNFPLRRIFIDEFYELKLRQANYYSWLGFGFLILISISSFNYGFSSLSTLIIWMLTFVIAYTFDELFNRQSQIRKLQRTFRHKPNDDSQSENPES